MYLCTQFSDMVPPSACFAPSLLAHHPASSALSHCDVERSEAKRYEVERSESGSLDPGSPVEEACPGVKMRESWAKKSPIRILRAPRSSVICLVCRWSGGKYLDLVKLRPAIREVLKLLLELPDALQRPVCAAQAGALAGLLRPHNLFVKPAVHFLAGRC